MMRRNVPHVIRWVDLHGTSECAVCLQKWAPGEIRPMVCEGAPEPPKSADTDLAGELRQQIISGAEHRLGHGPFPAGFPEGSSAFSAFLEIAVRVAVERVQEVQRVAGVEIRRLQAELDELRARFGLARPVTLNRCPSCEHRIGMHDFEGCRQEIGEGPGDEPACCPCQVTYGGVQHTPQPAGPAVPSPGDPQ